MRRLAAYADKRASEEFGRHLERLAAARASRMPLGRDLSAWLEALAAGGRRRYLGAQRSPRQPTKHAEGERMNRGLLATRDEPGRVAALEILINTPAVANLVRQGKLDQLESTMQAGGAVGMQTMDSALAQLVDAGRITALDAYHQANNKEKFREMEKSASFRAGTSSSGIIPDATTCPLARSSHLPSVRSFILLKSNQFLTLNFPAAASTADT